MDIPALGVDGACLSVIGQLGESRGVLVFASLDDFEAFVAAAESGALEQGPLALGAGWLALTFEPATELPASMSREAMEHGWPVERADAYPLVERRDPDGMPRPLVERDVEIAAACALSLGAFFAKHGATFKSDTFAPVCESYFDDDDREVRFTVPYDALADFELPDAAAPRLDAMAPAEPFRPRAGRNETVPVRERPQVQEVPPSGGRGRARRPAGRGLDARDGRDTGETSVGVRSAGVRRGLGGVRERLRQSRRGAAARPALVGLLLRGRGEEHRRRLPRGSRAPLLGGGAAVAGGATRGVALGVGSRGRRCRQDREAARPAVRRAAHGPRNARLKDACDARHRAGPHRRPRRRLAAVRDTSAPVAPLSKRPRWCGGRGHACAASGRSRWTGSAARPSGAT